MADFDVSELVGLADLLAEAPEQAIRAAHAAGIAVGAKIHADAKAAAPQDSGELAKSGIRRKSWRTKDGCHTDIFTVPVASGGTEGSDPKPRPVGFFVEYGTAGTPPNPFLSSQMVAGAPAYEAAVLAGLDPLLGGRGPGPKE